MARAMPSAEAPGANGTMTRMVFCVCANAGPDSTNIASKTARLISIAPSRKAAADFDRSAPSYTGTPKGCQPSSAIVVLPHRGGKPEGEPRRLSNNPGSAALLNGAF